MKFLNEEEAVLAKEKLEESLIIDPVLDSAELTSKHINWVDYKSWGDCKYKADEFMKELDTEGMGRFLFLAHSRDEIKGKPQLVQQSIQNITLIKRVVREEKDFKGNPTSLMTVYKFLDESFDKRYDGNLTAKWNQDFWVYRIFYESKEYYVFSEKELPLQSIVLQGMIVEMNDTIEMTRTMKINSLSKIFFCKEFETDTKILPPKELVEFVKEENIDAQKWKDHLDTHSSGKYNRFPENTNLLRSAHLLSSKIDGYPLHLGVIGPTGSRKSMGYIETIQEKFGDEYEIIEGANSRIKGLSPSFKEKPANIGYLARCDRIGWIDELGKMVEFEVMKHQTGITNVLGELNFLLDNKKRTVGSGNDNDCTVQATAKFIFASNPVKGKTTLQKHVGLIDPTTMSRIFWWVQGKEEQEFVLSEQGIVKIPPTHIQHPPKAFSPTNTPTPPLDSSVCVGGGFSPNTFLSLFDSCNAFLSDFNEKKAIEMSKIIENIARDPMKSVWKPRGLHHVSLLIDGLIKHRCLFEDQDDSFKAKEIDYSRAQSILIQMVNNWECDLSIKNDLYHGKENL